MVSELSPPVPGLSPTVPGLSRSVPGLSPAVPGLSSAVPGLSPAAPAVSPSVPAVSPPMPRDRAAEPGSARPSPVAAADPVAMLRAVADLATRTITVQDAASVASVLDDVVGELADLLGVAHVGLFQLDEQAGELTSRVGVLEGRRFGSDHHRPVRLPTGRSSMPGYTILQQRTVTTSDLVADRRFTALAPSFGVFARSAVNVPVPSAEGWWGVIGVYDVVPRSWQAHEIATVEAFAAIVGSMLHTVSRPPETPDVTLVTERLARRRAELAGARLATLSEASALFALSDDGDVVARTLLDTCVPALADGARLDLVDRRGRAVGTPIVTVGDCGGPSMTTALRAIPAEALTDLVEVVDLAPRGAGPASDHSDRVAHPARRTRRFVARTTRADLPEVLHPLADQIGLVAEPGGGGIVVAPLVLGERLLGVLTLLDGSADRRTTGHLGLIEDLASRASVSLDTCRRLEARTRVVDSLQTTLAPPLLPADPNTTFAARYQCADPDLAVGGDFYDVVDLGEGAWAALVGDVCGRGPGAAALSGVVRQSTRAAMVVDAEPRRVLERTNAAVVSQLDDFGFCTLTYLHLAPSPTGMRATVSSAGHPRPVVVRADGRVEVLDCGGAPLGVVAHPIFDEVAVDLAPGDAVVLYTDGVTEARGPDGLFGEERLIEVMGGLVGAGADLLAETLDFAVRSHRRGDGDDLAILVVAVPPVG